MPSHYSSIGFAVEDPFALTRLAEHAARSGDVHELGDGCYVQWAPGGGAELWVQATEDSEIVGLNPFYAGTARMKLGLLERIVRDDDQPLDGAFRAVASPYEDRVGGEIPLCFDAPDARRYADLPLPSVAEVAMVAFSHGLAAFPSEGEFRLAQPEFRLSVGSLFSPALAAPEPTTEPPSRAQFSGRVLAAEVRENAFSGGRYQWTLIEVPGGQLDVVADIDLVDGAPVAGGVIAGTGWLMGRVLRVY